jgi:hypothetical protein
MANGKAIFPKKLVARGNKIHDSENPDTSWWLAEVGSEEGAAELVRRWNAYKPKGVP